MKTKRRIILISVLLILVALIVLSSAIFSLKSVELVFYNNDDIKIADNTKLVSFSEDDFSSVIKSAEFKMGSSVFFIKKSVHIERLEKQNPYIKIINIQTVFPNKLIIKAVERQDFYSLKLTSGYAILDGELKILKLMDNLVGYEDLIVLDGLGVNIAAKGTFLNDGVLSTVAKIKDYLKISNYNHEGSLSVFSKILLIKETDAEGKNQFSIMFSTIYESDKGLDIYIKNIENNLENKIFKAINAYDDILSPEPPHADMTPREGQIRVLDDLTTYYSND